MRAARARPPRRVVLGLDARPAGGGEPEPLLPGAPRPPAPRRGPGDGRRPRGADDDLPPGGGPMSFYTRQADELRRRGRVRAEHARYLATRLDKRALLRRAWALARAGARRFGGT